MRLTQCDFQKKQKCLDSALRLYVALRPLIQVLQHRFFWSSVCWAAYFFWLKHQNLR